MFISIEQWKVLQCEKKEMMYTLGRVSRFMKRFYRRLRHTFNFKTMWRWDFESCDRCGACYHISYMLKDELWERITSPDNKLCINCLFKLAVHKGVHITKDDFLFLETFSPEKSEERRERR